MENNLEILAIQHNKNDLNEALNRISAPGSSLVLFTNLFCKLKMGNEMLRGSLFDTALYSENDNLLILLMNHGPIKVDELRECLDEKKLPYHEVSFTRNLNERKKKQNLPHLYFAHDCSSLEKVFKKSGEKNEFRVAEYYPFLSSSLDLGYVFSIDSIDNNYLPLEARDYCSIEKQVFRGLIRLNGKVILLMHNQENSISATQV